MTRFGAPIAAVVGAAAAAVLAVLVAGQLGLGSSATARPVAAVAPSTASPTSPAPTVAPGPLFAGGYQDPATDAASGRFSAVVPTHVRIPAIGVDTGLEQLGLTASGSLAPPVDYDLAGWFSGGVVPGQIGPSIIAGHVDSETDAAVFYRLGDLTAGDEVDIDLSDGTTVVFTVTGSEQSPKSQFPTSDVYSTVPQPELRLITCAGAFDRDIGHYTDNLIVFASLRA